MIKTLDSEIDDVTEKVAKLKEARQISKGANKAKILEKEVNQVAKPKKSIWFWR